MIHAAISKAAQQEPLPYFEKALVEIEIVTPRGTNNAQVWDTSNRAIQLILNNLKGIFFVTMIWNIWHFLWSGDGAKKVSPPSVFRHLTNDSKSDPLVLYHENAKTMDFR